MAPSERAKRACKVCNHPGLIRVNEMLTELDAGKYTLTTIVQIAAHEHPNAPLLTKQNLSRHRREHLLMSAANEDATDDDQPSAITFDVAIEDMTPNDIALYIARQGIANIKRQPHLVSVNQTIEAIKILKTGNGGNSKELEEMREAWGKLNVKRGKSRVKVTQTVERELEEEGEPDTGVIDVTPVRTGPPQLPTTGDLVWKGSEDGIPITAPDRR